MATIAGNVCSGLPWADLPAIFLALDAEFIFSNKKVLKVKEFVSSPKDKIKKAILIAIKIPLANNLKYAYVRMPRANADDIPLVSVCLVGKKSDVRVAINFGNNFPARMPKTEESIKKKDSEDNLVKVLSQEAEKIEKDNYRREMILVCFRQALEKYAKL
jgi:CO/xanthine dehydrogenase FAD-binding subunit